MQKKTRKFRVLAIDPGTTKQHVRKPIKQMKQQLKDRFDGKIKLVGKYRGAHFKTEFECRDCGDVRISNFYEKLKAKYGCKGCATKRFKTYTHKEFVSKLSSAGHLHKIQILEKYKRSQSPLKVKCVACSHIWSPVPNSLMNGAGCPECAKYIVNTYSPKRVVLGKRKVWVQGYEPYALEYLVKIKKKDPSRIQVFSDKSIPVFTYKYKNKMKEYRPDFKIGNRIYEVKSIWTLLFQLEVNKLKAKACLEAGTKFTLLIASPEKTVKLPPEWLKWNAQKINKWFIKKTAKPLTILALDPGVNNFGWAVLQENKAQDFEVLATGMIQNTIRDLKFDIRTQTESFRNELQKCAYPFKINAVAIERFMSRGHGGTTIEVVNQMIGIVISHYLSKKLLIIPASQWKNEFNRNSNLEKFYAAAPTCTVHQLDAIGIGLYASYYWHDVKPFENFNKVLKGVAKQACQNNYLPIMKKLKKKKK